LKYWSKPFEGWVFLADVCVIRCSQGVEVRRVPAA